VKPRLAAHLGEVFGLQIRAAEREELMQQLQAAEHTIAVPA